MSENNPHPQFLLDLWDNLQKIVDFSSAPPSLLSICREVYLGGAKTVVTLPYVTGVPFSELEREVETYGKLVMNHAPTQLIDLGAISPSRHLSDVWEKMPVIGSLPERVVQQNLFFSGARDLLWALVNEEVDKDEVIAWLAAENDTP